MPIHYVICCTGMSAVSSCPLVMAFDPGCLAETGHLTGASTSAAARHHAERTATMQAPVELAEWLRDYGFHREAVAAVESMAFTVEPTLAITQANVEALQSVLRMGHAQVELVRASVCCGRSVLHPHRLVGMCMHRQSYVRASLELLYHRLQEHSPSHFPMSAKAGAHDDA